MTHLDENNARMHKVAQQAKAAATVLHEEFQTPFRVSDAATGTRLWPQIVTEGETDIGPQDIAEFEQLAKTNQVRVALLPGGDYRLRLPLSFPGSPVLIAQTEIKALASSSPAATAEQIRLERWAQAVLERLLQADVLRSRRYAEDDLRQQLKQAWELNLSVDRLIRHLRIHRDVDTSLKQILDAALPFVGAQTLIWVPHKLDPVHICGEALLSMDAACDLIKTVRRSPELRDSGLLLCNEVRETEWGESFPNVSNVMVLSVPSGSSCGWMIALNKTRPASGEGFRHSDAASLAPFAALAGFLMRACDRYHELKDLLVGLTRSLASAVDAKDPYTYGHSERVARIAVELGRELNLSDDELSDLYLAGLLHDIGKIGIRDDVLGKHGPLTPEETDHIQQHPTIGHAILKDLRQINSVLPGVLHHHERWDGKGYPTGLAGETIPRLARILAVADSYDAMSTCRPYRNAKSPATVEQILADGAGQQWDPRVIEAFQRSKARVRTIRERGLGESLRQALDGALRDTGSSRVLPKTIVLSVGSRS